MSCEARTCCSGEVISPKRTFFPLLLNRAREARALCGFQHHIGITCFVSVFWNDNCWPHFRSEKKHPEIGQAPTSQARPRDADHLRPSNLAGRTINIVEHTISKFGGDRCPVNRGFAPAVKCYCLWYGLGKPVITSETGNWSVFVLLGWRLVFGIIMK